MRTSKSLITVFIFSLIVTFGYSQNVGVGTPAPEEKLHVAGNLKVDSVLKINRIELRDSLGDLRLSFDANSGSFQMWDNDTLWYRTDVNSPKKDTTWTSDSTFTETFVQDKNYYERKYKKSGSAHILVYNRCGHNDPDKAFVGFPYKLEQFYKNGCKTIQIEMMKVDDINLPAEVVVICGDLTDIGEVIIKTWYDCPFNPEKVLKTEFYTKKGKVTFYYNAAGEVESLEWEASGKKLSYKKGVNEATVRVEKGDTIETTKFKGSDMLRVKRIADGSVKTVKTVEDVNNNRKVTTTTCPREGKIKIELHDSTAFEINLCKIIKGKQNSVIKEEEMLEEAYRELFRKGPNDMGFGFDPNEQRVDVEGVKKRSYLVPPSQEEFTFEFEHQLGDFLNNHYYPATGEEILERPGASISQTTLKQDSVIRVLQGLFEAIQTEYILTNGNPHMIISSQNNPLIMQLIADVNISGLLSKFAGTFKIDHPQDPYNKYLYHSFVESPDMMNIYNGNAITDELGLVTVDLPGYFDDLNIEPRYQLTVIGNFAQAIVKEEVNNNQFTIQTSEPNTKVSWQVTGIRNDVFARENRIVDEVEKSESEKGKLLYKSKEIKKPDFH